MKYPDLYKKYFVDKEDERQELFRIIQKEFKIQKGLYPGSFVHITPSLFIPQMVYVDSDKRCQKFFADDLTTAFVMKNKEYDSQPVYRFHQSNFESRFDEEDESFDLLISLYAGSISQHCQRYVKKNGIIVANNSHGDAPLAFLDNNLEFIAVVKRSGNKFRVSQDSLDSYFITRSGNGIKSEEVRKTMRGPAYTKVAYAYLFRKL